MYKVKTVAVLSIALMLGGWGCSKQADDAVTNVDTAPTTPTTTVATSTTKAPVKKPAPSVVSQGLKYEEALEKYRESGLMQFVDCHATPGTFTVKKGYTFMIDNRDAKARTIVIQGATYRLGAYSYALVTPQKIGESFVTCDGGGSGTLKVQA